METITALIPARYKSTRFPGKPLADIAGKPLIEWTYTNASKCEIFNRVIVATDDVRIKEAVERFGGNVCLTSNKHVSGTDRIAEASDKLKIRPETIIVNIQGDEPLVEPECLKKLVEPLIRGKAVKMSTLCYLITSKEEIDNPNIVKVVSDKYGRALYFSRAAIPFSPDGKGRFYKHIGLYAYRKKFLSDFSRMKPTELEKRERLEQLRALENGVGIIVSVSDSDPVEVDVPQDINKVIEIINTKEAY